MCNRALKTRKTRGASADALVGMTMRVPDVSRLATIWNAPPARGVFSCSRRFTSGYHLERASGACGKISQV